MTDTNVNFTADELAQLQADRHEQRLARKEIRRRRYLRRYACIRAERTWFHTYSILLSDVVTITFGPLTTYGTPAITRDDLT